MSPPSSALSAELVTFVDDEVSSGLEPVESDTDLLLSGLVDSLGVVRVVGWLEERLGIRVDPADVVLEHFSSIDAIVAYLRNRGDVEIT